MVDDRRDIPHVTAEVGRLHVDENEVLVLLERPRRDVLDANTKLVDEPPVLRTRHSTAGHDRGLGGARAEDRAQGKRRRNRHWGRGRAEVERRTTVLRAGHAENARLSGAR